MNVSPANVDLLVAMMDLKLVQSVIGAMRAADAAVAGMIGHASASRNPQPSPQPAPKLGGNSNPRIAPRRVIHPTPRFEPRTVIHPAPREAPVPPQFPPVTDERPRIHNFHLIPPWKVLPWKNPPQPATRIKVVKRRPDIPRTGALLNVVI